MMQDGLARSNEKVEQFGSRILLPTDWRLAQCDVKAELSDVIFGDRPDEIEPRGGKLVCADEHFNGPAFFVADSQKVLTVARRRSSHFFAGDVNSQAMGGGGDDGLGSFPAHAVHCFESLRQTLIHFGTPLALDGSIAKTKILKGPYSEGVEVRAAIEVAEANIGPVAASSELPGAEPDGKERDKRPDLFLTQSTFGRGDLGGARCDFGIGRNCNRYEPLQVSFGIDQFNQG